MKNSFVIIDQIIRSLAIVKKGMKIYYSKGPVVLMGVLWPAFMFISFAFGRNMAARTLERLVSTPIAVWTILFGDMMASAITGVILSIVPVIIAIAVGAQIVDPLVLTVAIILGAVCFSTASLLLSVPPVAQPAPIQMLSTLIKFPLMFISGVFIPLSEMPAIAQTIAFVSPLTYFTDLARYATGGANYFGVGVDITVLVAFAVVAWIIAVKLHNRTLPMRV